MQWLTLAWVSLSVLSGPDSGCNRKSPSGRSVGGTPQAVKVGKTMTVSLPSNPSTGYRWHWSNRAAVRHLDTTGWSYDTKRPGVPGAGGVEKWTFTGLSKGRDTIRLEYRRPWETVAAARDTAIDVRVR